jgi:hypothetical protein
MNIAEESFTRMIEQQNSIMQGQDPADARLWVRFEFRPKPEYEKSAEAGRPIFSEEEWIIIMVPGDRDTVERPITPQDKIRFSKQYDHWKATGKESVTGTPLEAWPAITRAQVEELKHFRVRTVEDLANLNDAATATGMGLQSLKQKAKAFIEAASGNGGAKFQAAIEAKDAQIASMQNLLKEQSEKIEALLKAKR